MLTNLVDMSLDPSKLKIYFTGVNGTELHS
jgi:hypothetical protein